MGVLWITHFYPRLDQYVDTTRDYGKVFGSIDTNNLFDIYNVNKDQAAYKIIEPERMEIYKEVALMNAKDEGDVFFVGDYHWQKLCIAIADEPDIDYWNLGTKEECLERIKRDYKYVCVVDPEYATIDILDYLSTLELSV